MWIVVEKAADMAHFELIRAHGLTILPCPSTLCVVRMPGWGAGVKRMPEHCVHFHWLHVFACSKGTCSTCSTHLGSFKPPPPVYQTAIAFLSSAN